MRQLSIMLVLAGLGAVGCSPHVTMAQQPEYAEIDTANHFRARWHLPIAQARDTVARMCTEQGLRLGYGTDRGSSYARQYSTWQPVPDSDSAMLGNYLGTLMLEWQVYPPEFARCIGLKGIELVRDLKVQGTPRAAMPDAEGMVLYLDVTYLHGSGLYARKVIHHELYHLVEHALFGTMFARERSWTRLNPVGFSYRADGGAAAYSDPNYRSESHPQPGFVSAYSLYSPEEDRAEVFAYMFTQQLRQSLVTWLPEDEILRNKVNWIKTHLRERCPNLMNEAFWRNLGL